MSNPYFFIDSENISSNEIIIDGDNHNHLTKVLRARIKEKVDISDNKEYRYTAEIFEINKKRTLLKITEKRKITEEKIKISLFQCMLKRSSMELVIQKAAELGIYDIFPVKSKRVVTEDKSGVLKTKRWEKIAEEASKQCKRDFILKINGRISFDDIEPLSFDIMYLPYEELDKASLKEKNVINDLKDLRDKANLSQNLKIGFIIGPEGGFEESEVHKLTLKGAKALSLGSNILKAETASIFLSSIIKYTSSVFI
ncbi:MAG: RsmE family RNA methyltransferase [Actinomycetota bacterium]|nr:RsmE family RNA methyltransferase [Actinomycetota bacterium]